MELEQTIGTHDGSPLVEYQELMERVARQQEALVRTLTHLLRLPGSLRTASRVWRWKRQRSR